MNLDKMKIRTDFDFTLKKMILENTEIDDISECIYIKKFSKEFS